LLAHKLTGEVNSVNQTSYLEQKMTDSCGNSIVYCAELARSMSLETPQEAGFFRGGSSHALRSACHLLWKITVA